MTQAMTQREQKNVPRRWFESGPLTTLRDEMDELFNSFFGGADAATPLLTPSVDVAETEETVEVTTDLPGYKPEEIEVAVHDNVLTISGQTSREDESTDGKDRKFHRIERRRGRFSRSVRLPCGVDEEHTDAELRNGVLTIKMLKAKDAIGKKISIKS